MTFIDWFLSRPERETPKDNETDRLEVKMKVTAANRYTASNRLRWQGKFAFATTTILSLGLIFIPLMQMARVPLILKGDVLNAMQIFLAVSVLVYSVMIGTARYDLRCEQLSDCGDKIKELIWELRREKEASGGPLNKEQLCQLQARYSAITTDVENHTQNDYRLTMLQLVATYKITGIVRVMMWLQYWVINLSIYLPSLVLLAVELVFISDMFGATSVFAKFLNGAYVPAG